MGEVSYKGHRYPAEIIAHCVWLYHRFALSFGEVEELMAHPSTRPACAAANPDPATSGISTRCS